MLDERRRAAHERLRLLCRGRADSGQHVRVDAALKARPARGPAARERVLNLHRVRPGQPLQLAAVEDVLGAPDGHQQARVDVTAMRGVVAQHRHQRHQPRAAGQQQQRATVLHAPRERSTDGTAQLERVTGAQFPGQVGRHLAVIDLLDRQCQLRRLRRRGDRVRALGLIAVLGGQANVDVLARVVPGPAGHVQVIVFACEVSSAMARTVATRQTIGARLTLNRSSSAALARGRRSCGSPPLPRTPARRRR